MPRKYYKSTKRSVRKRYGRRNGKRKYGRRKFKRLLGGSKLYGKKTYWRAKLVPRVLCIKMPYHTWDTLAAVQYDSNYYRGNGPWDPEYAAGGYQPPTWDDIANLYYEYICVGSKITVKFINTGTQTVNVLLKAEQGDGSFNPNTYEMFDQEDCYVKTLSPQTSGASNSCTLSMYRSTRTMMGKNPLNSAELTSTISTLPATRWSWIVGAFDRTPGDLSIQVDTEVQLKYYVVFRKRVNALSQDA